MDTSNLLCLSSMNRLPQVSVFPALCRPFCLALLLIYSAPNRYYWEKNTCRLTALTINLRTKKHSVIWEKVITCLFSLFPLICEDGLPLDSHHLVPVPLPVGGVLLFSPDVVLYLSPNEDDVPIPSPSSPPPHVLRQGSLSIILVMRCNFLIL